MSIQKRFREGWEWTYHLDGIIPIKGGIRRNSPIYVDNSPKELQDFYLSTHSFLFARRKYDFISEMNDFLFKLSNPIRTYYDAEMFARALESRKTSLKLSELLKKSGIEIKFLPAVFESKSICLICHSPNVAVFLRKEGADEDKYRQLEKLEEELCQQLSTTKFKIALHPTKDVIIPYDNIFHNKEVIISLVKTQCIEMGRLLEYPECCIKNYAEGFGRKDRRTAQAKLAVECILDEKVFKFYSRIFERPSELEKIVEEELPPFCYSTPYIDFYPHSIYCDNAIKIGKDLEEVAKNYGVEKEMREKFLITPLKQILTLYQNTRRLKSSELSEVFEVFPDYIESLKKVERDLPKKGAREINEYIEQL